LITIKSASNIESMKKAGQVVYDTLQAVKAAVQPGIDTLSLDSLAERLIRSRGAIPSFKGYNGFPYTLCISVDDEVVHGFPSSSRILREGQIVSIDCGAIVEGFHSDSALTVAVGKVDPEKERLMRITEECFYKGMEQAVEGNHIGDVAHAVQKHAEAHGYGVVRSLCGHGIGRNMHEDPEVPNFGTPGRGIRLRAGMTICIEPMITQKDYSVVVGSNGWVVRTKDGGAASHYEHTILIRKDQPPQILSLPPSWQKEEA